MLAHGINTPLIAAAIFLLCGVKSATASDSYTLLRLAESWVKWGKPTIGTRARVTYALTKGRRESPKALNCRSILPIDPLLRRSGIALGVFHRELKAAFAAWSRVADITFLPVDDAAEADIVIGAQRGPRGRAFTNVSFDEISGKATKSIRKSLICLNPAARWKVGFDGNVDVYDLHYTLLHEIGHAIGLDHPGPSGQVMSFQYNEKFRSLRDGDANGVSRLYGNAGRLAAGAVESVVTNPGSQDKDNPLHPAHKAPDASERGR